MFQIFDAVQFKAGFFAGALFAVVAVLLLAFLYAHRGAIFGQVKRAAAPVASKVHEELHSFREALANLENTAKADVQAVASAVKNLHGAADKVFAQINGDVRTLIARADDFHARISKIEAAVFGEAHAAAIEVAAHAEAPSAAQGVDKASSV